MPPIADLHLDLAWVTTLGRDLTRPAATQPDVGFGDAAVSLPELQAGGTRLVGATLFALPAGGMSHPGYRDQPGAAAQCRNQLAIYQSLPLSQATQADGLQSVGPKAVILMEGADALAFPDEDEHATPRAWHARGVRIVGLAWHATRFAGGTGEPGPLTDAGRRIVPLLDDAGLIHDASHLADESLDGLLDLATGPILASHSNCRALVRDDPAQRHLRDDHVAAITARGGVVGINLFDKFLLPPDVLATRRATLADWTAHVRHVCDLAGDARHVALGSDADGGFGKLRLPVELGTVADYPKLADALSAAGFGDADVRAILHDNAAGFLQRSLR